MHPVEALLSPVGWMLRNRRADEAAGLAGAAELASPNRIVVTSPAFADGAEIPARHCGRFIGEDISPALSWSELPARTADLVLIIEDPDVPTTIPGLHAIAEFTPLDGGLPEGALEVGRPGVAFLPNHRGGSGYQGPRPLPGHGPHRYRFHLFATDTHIDFATIAIRQNLPAAMAGHVLASGVLTGIRTS